MWFISETGFLHDWPARCRQLVAEGHQESGWQQKNRHRPGKIHTFTVWHPVISVLHILNQSRHADFAFAVAATGSATVHSGTEGLNERGAGRHSTGNPAKRGRGCAGQDEEGGVQISSVWGLQVSYNIKIYSRSPSFNTPRDILHITGTQHSVKIKIGVKNLFSPALSYTFTDLLLYFKKKKKKLLSASENFFTFLITTFVWNLYLTYSYKWKPLHTHTGVFN